MVSITDTLRTVLITSGETRYAVSMATGIPQSVLCRFVSGESVNGRTLDALAAHFKLELRPTKTPPKTARAKKGGR